MELKHHRRTWRRMMISALAGLATLTSVLPTAAAPWTNRNTFAAPAFQSVWSASDQDVANGRVARSYTWGPAPWFDYKELYRQSPNGLRQVQYFDKARMEMNNPAESSTRGVTNGLLTVELVSGRLKVGNGINDDENFPRQPANVPVAGDPANENPAAPTYASFRGVATLDNGYRDADRSGQRIGTVLDKFGNRTENAELAKDAATTIVTYNTITGHNVPRVFRDFIQNGPVDGLFAFGYPITDPYWIRARVGGVEKDVFVQLYERRVVTYTPSNPAAYRVEMGNVGQHYFQWRYPHLGQPWLPSAGEYWNLPIAYASKAADPTHWEVYLLGGNGISGPQITAERAETVPYSWRRSYIGGAKPRLMTDSKREQDARKLYSIDITDYRNVQAHSPSGVASAHYFNAAVSPDGTQIIMAILHPDGTSALGIQSFDMAQSFPALITPFDQTCTYQSPTWLPNGAGIVYAASCGGKFGIYRADLQYTFASADGYIGAQLVNIRPVVVTQQADNYLPRVSPDGSKVAFASNREGQNELYVVNLDGSSERRLTVNPVDDGAGTWSPDGNELIFDSNRDGDYELYKLNINNPGVVTQLTNNTVDDRWPIWFQ